MTKRRLAWLLGSAVVAIVLLLAAAWATGLWLMLGGPPGPRTAAALARLRDAGYAPSEATDIFISDTHDGFHGDGDTLLVYACSRSCLDGLKQRISKDYEPQIQRAMTSDWSAGSAPRAAHIQRTLEWIASTDHG